MDFAKPSLIEPGVKYFLNETLKHCHDFKVKHNNTLFNCFLFGCFLVILGILLIYKYKGKLSQEEKRKKEAEKQQYILAKIKNYQDAKKIAQQELITGLPQWDSEYELIGRKIK